jgi:hypothetical protein
MSIAAPFLPLLLALAPAPEGGAFPPESLPARDPLQRELDARARATLAHIVPFAWETGRKETIFADAAAKAGSLGGREGDLDQQIQTVSGEPGVTRYFASYGGRPPVATAYAIGQTSGGRIVIAGQVGQPSGSLPTRIGIIQFRSNGTIDTGFFVSDVGRQYIDIANPNLHLVAGLALLDEIVGTTFLHRIYLLAEDRSNPSQYNFALLCLRRPLDDPTLAFDPCPGFGSAGVRYYNANLAGSCPTNHSRPGAIAVGTDASNAPVLYLGGSAQRTYNGCGDHDFAVLQVNLAGDPQTGFGSLGTGWTTRTLVHTDGNPPYSCMVRSLAALPAAGGVFYGGSLQNALGSRHAIVGRFEGNGAISVSFCPSANASCDSPNHYRNGSRGFSTLLSGEVTAIGILSTSSGGRLAVVRSRTTSSDAARAQLLNASGGCLAPLPCNEVVLAPAFGDAPVYPAAILPRLDAQGFLDPRLFVLAGWGMVADPSTPVDGKAVAIALRDNGAGSLELDPGFVSTPGAGHRNVITWPNLSGPSAVRDTRIHAALRDRQGRILLAGSSRATDASGGEYDMSFARLQGGRVFADGFESP